MATTFDEDRKLRRAAENMVKLGIVTKDGFDLKDKPGTLDENKVRVKIEEVRRDMVEKKDIPANSSMDAVLELMDKTAASQQKANAAPAATAATTAPAAKTPNQADVRAEDARQAAAAASAAPAKKPDAATTHTAPAQPKPRSADEMKTEEAQAYLRVLGKKDLAEFRADNLLNGGADLKGKELTSPEVLAALKARVTGTPEAQAFARQMLQKDATTDRKSSQNLNGQDVVALQYMLKANGQDIGTFGQNKNGIDGIQGAYTIKAAEAVASPSFIKGGPDAKASTQAPTPAQTRPASPAAPAQGAVRAPQQPAPGLPVDGGVGSPTQGQQPQRTSSGRPIPAEEWVGGPMTAQPPAGAQLAPYPQPGYSPSTIGVRNGMAPHFTGQAAGGVIVTDPQTRISYNPYTGQYMNPTTGHAINPQDRNRDGDISPGEYRSAVNEDNLATRGTYRTGNVRGMMPVLSQWTGGFPDIRERAYGRQDGMMTQRQVQSGYNDISRGVAAMTDRSPYNNGQGLGALVGGALKIFDPFGQQTPRGPRF